MVSDRRPFIEVFCFLKINKKFRNLSDIRYGLTYFSCNENYFLGFLSLEFGEISKIEKLRLITW